MGYYSEYPFVRDIVPGGSRDTQNRAGGYLNRGYEMLSGSPAQELASAGFGDHPHLGGEENPQRAGRDLVRFERKEFNPLYCFEGKGDNPL